MQTRRASIKETGEELSQADWERFDAAVAQVKAEQVQAERQKEQASKPARGAVAPIGRQGEAKPLGDAC